MASVNPWAWYSSELDDPVDPRLTWALAGSFVLHMAVSLVMILNLRMPSASDQPGTAYQVTLVTLPATPPPPRARIPSPVFTPVPDVAPLPRLQPVPPPVPPVTPPPPVRTMQPMTEMLTNTVRSVRVPELTKAPSDDAGDAPFAEAEPRNAAPRVAPPVPPPLADVRLEPLPAERKPRENVIASLPIPEVSTRQPGVALTVRETLQDASSESSDAGSSAEVPYRDQIQDRIRRQWLLSALRQRPPLQVVLAIRLGRTGRVKALTVNRSSGNLEYDLLAQRAVTAASPFPPFPPTITKDDLDIHYTFNFQYVQ